MKKPYVIGIGGGTASGKSTFTEKLEAELTALKVKTFHMDAYFKPKEERPFTKAFVSGIEYTDDNHPQTIYHEKLTQDIIDALGEDFDAIIVEGLLALWYDAIHELLDLKIFVDCRADERIVRRIKRNTQKGQTIEQITDFYMDMVRYRHEEYVEPSKWRADIILNGSKFSDQALAIIKDHVLAAAHNGKL